MLIEEQAAALLTRCEKLLGIELRQIRGNLRRASSRAAAVWELLVMEAASHLGLIEYEPHPGASPDIRLRIKQGRAIWLEAAYLYPRFWDEERRSDAVMRWLLAEAERRGLPRGTIHLRFDGAPQSQAGYVRILPKLHEKTLLLKHLALKSFFNEILCDRSKVRTCALSPYSVSIAYSPNIASSPFIGGGFAQEAATAVSEHAVYRTLREKAQQHDVAGPRVICVGSDQSPSLSPLNGPGTGRPSGRDAAMAALSRHQSVSAAFIVTIRNMPTNFGLERQARGQIITNPTARDQLTQDELRLLASLDFNRWSYTYPLPKWESGNPQTYQRRLSGRLTVRPGGIGMKIEIPTDIVIDALAGKTSLLKAFRLSDDEQVTQALKDGWSIVSCGLVDGDLEAGEAPKLMLELVPSHVAVFWPKKTSKKTGKDKRKDS
jgi:hypothetical protein